MSRQQFEPMVNIDSNSSQQTENSQTITKKDGVDENNQQTAITIRVGSDSFRATLADNVTARAFRERLPLTLTMHDVNSNEKAFDLSNALPSSPLNPGRIQNGDLMLYGSQTLVLFYESFDTSYTYTRIGHIDEPENLAETLGSGEAKVTFQH